MIYLKYGDLFVSSCSCSLAQCISADARMSKGISVKFVEHFPVVKNLQSEFNILGTAKPVFVMGRNKFVYNLISKQSYWLKPTLNDLYSSLLSMRSHAELFGVTDISMPKIGSGCDKLNFPGTVLPMIIRVFENTSVNIYIYTISLTSNIRYV